METFVIILTTIASTLGVTVAIWTMLDTRKRYPKQSPDAQKEPDILAIRLPAEIQLRLENLAKRTGRTRSFHARKGIREYLENLDDLDLAGQVARRIERGEQRASSLADVEGRLDSSN